MKPKKLLVVQVAALDAGVRLDGLDVRPMRPAFPAVTCTAQASFRTALPAGAHGVVGNGWLFGDLRKVLFWEQSARLVAGERIWSNFRKAGGRVGMLFWQQSLGEDADVILSPAPIHKHHGGMIQDCYAKPAGLYDELCQAIGKKFNLMHYWGPLASAKVGDWIAAATAEVMRREDLAPDLLLTYLPSLDYDLQRHGPTDPRSDRARSAVRGQIATLLAAAERSGYDVLVFGDYAIQPVTGPAIFPNRALAEAGLLAIRNVHGRQYADLHASRAFAVADHQVAHLYAPEAADAKRAADLLNALDGVAEVLDRPAQADRGLSHPNGGNLLLVADAGRWLAYPWWTGRRREPDYASHVDIHNKPGYDPCELFFGWPPMSVSRDPSRVRGTHGRAAEGDEVALASTAPALAEAEDLTDLAARVRDYLQT